jgi:aminopeptidase YwaD
LDAIQFSSVDESIGLPVAQISSRSYSQIQAAVEAGGAELSLKARVEIGGRETRTLVATIVGASLPNEVVALSSHLEAPGASDNATGAAGQLENALTLVRVLEAGGLSAPARSLAFIWGQENQEATDWLTHQNRRAIAAVNAVMIGESFKKTGARALLERYPDPGALVTVAPDEHTLWGSRSIDANWLAPNGLSIIARCAMVDVSQHVGGWMTFENPYEGGTDHERFIDSGVPAVLFWHFTDFTFHTSLDRLEMVDSAELKRMAVAALATAMALADPRPQDLTRYLRSVDHERQARVDAALAAGEDAVAEDWRVWCTGVRQWFRIMCLHLEGEQARLPGVMRSLSLEETTE